LDDKIELNRRMSEMLEGMARAIFKSWFVDFDPVRAKAAGSDTGLPKPIADLFPDSFEDSELREIPKGWKTGTVNDIAETNSWTLGKADELEEIDYVEISAVMQGEINVITRYHRGNEPSRARRRLRHGDSVLSTVRPDRGAHFLCLNPSTTLIASTGFAVLSPKRDEWAFLYSALTRPEIGTELGHLADGGAYPAIRPEVVTKLSLVLPENDRLISLFEGVAQPLYLKAATNREQIRILASLRDTLLSKLISGELRVPDAKRIVARVG
jgi:type I restriction enzyme S subunit